MLIKAKIFYNDWSIESYPLIRGYVPDDKLQFVGIVQIDTHEKCLTDLEICEEVFDILNIHHPHNWKTRSMCVGDVILLEGAYSCDTVGFSSIDTLPKECYEYIREKK